MIRIITLCFCLLLNSLDGQIIIDQNDYFKFDNKYFRGRLGQGLDSIDLNQSIGPNQVWDFTWLEDNFTDTLNIVKADLTPFFSEFPTADFGISSNLNNYFYEDISPDGVTILGRVNFDPIFSANTVYRFNSTAAAFQFPLIYNNTYTFEYNYRVKYAAFLPGADSIRQFNSSSFEILADAWGQLQLPIGNFDVLRIKQTAFLVDTVSVYDSPGGWGGTTISHDTTLTWLYYAKEIGYRLLSFNQRINNTGKNVNWLKGYTIASQETIDQPKVSIFPQPATDLLTINIEDDFAYTIYDITGKLLLNGNLQKGSNSITISTLSPGIYILTLKDTTKYNNFSKRLVISSK
jgi:hypothetical protein